jgi:hypothetical protein
LIWLAPYLSGLSTDADCSACGGISSAIYDSLRCGEPRHEAQASSLKFIEDTGWKPVLRIQSTSKIPTAGIPKGTHMGEPISGRF